MRVRRFLALLAAAAALTLVDQVTKAIAAAQLKRAAAVQVIPNFFNLAYVENRGCAWGMLQGKVWPLAVFAALALATVIWKRDSIFGRGKIAAIAEPLLYAGIVGNLIDRVFRGYVIDFFDFHWAEAYHFPCFNVADACICCAAGLIMLVAFLTGGGDAGSKGADAKGATGDAGRDAGRDCEDEAGGKGEARE